VQNNTVLHVSNHQIPLTKNLRVTNYLRLETFVIKLFGEETDEPKHVAVLCNIQALCLTLYLVCSSVAVNTAELIRIMVKG